MVRITQLPNTYAYVVLLPAGCPGYKLPLMRYMRAVAIALAVVSCGDASREDAAPPAIGKVAPVPARTGPTGWHRGAGPALIAPVPGSVVDVMIVLPDVSDGTASDTTSFDLDLLPDRKLDLLGAGSRPETGEIVADAASAVDCGIWPTARLQRVPTRPWRIAFAEGMVLAAPLDSLLTDSVGAQRLAGQAARLAGAGAFSGIPFTVRSAYRASFGERRVLAGEVFRRINSEANAREQRVFVVIEKSARETPERVVHHETSAGSENDVTAVEILAAAWIDGQPSLVTAYESERGIRFGMITADSAGNWKRVWRSARASCS